VIQDDLALRIPGLRPGETPFLQPLVTHPRMQMLRFQRCILCASPIRFHPFSGRQLSCVGERYNRYGMRLLLQIDDHSVCSVPPQWTDVVAPDHEVVMGEHRALFRVVDLLDLAGLVDRLRRPGLPERQNEV
jgi:hypothetical protein